MPSENDLHLMVGTGNAHKTEEIAACLADLGVKISDARILPETPEIIEDGATFEANAEIKARAFAREATRLPADRRPRWVLSDDSGLSVDALDGAPGVHSARYSEDLHGPDPTDEQNNRKLLDALEGVPPERRTARFVCTLVLVEVPQDPGDTPARHLEARGECEGRILEAGRGEQGFGYDPLFWVPSLDQTFGEASPEVKNRLSHRARALEKLREKLETELSR